MDNRSAYKRYVLDRFTSEDEIWDKNNTWSAHVKKTIQLSINCFFDNSPVNSKSLVLNAGSGDTNYGIDNCRSVNLDIVESKVSKLKNSIVADLEKLPFADETFTHIICVGSVINYCDPIISISELSRVLKYNGKLLIDFDSTDSHEFMFSEKYCSATSFIDTFYNGLPDHLFIYSRNYIRNILALNSLTVSREKPYHIISPLIYFLTRSEQLSGVFGWFDLLINKYKLPNTKSSSIALFCEKR